MPLVPLAAALSYGIYKTDMPADKTTYVAFVDVGAMDTTVSIVGFVKGKLTVLSTACDRQLGGRDFDMLLAKRFAAEWKEKHGIDAHTNKKVWNRTVPRRNWVPSLRRAEHGSECLVPTVILGTLRSLSRFPCASAGHVPTACGL